MALTFALSFALSVALTLLARVAGTRLGLIDQPRDRHRHPAPIVKFGALPLWGAFTLTALLTPQLPVERGDPNEMIRLAGLLFGGTFIFLFGIFDDKYTLSSLQQYVAQIITASIGVLFLIFIERFNNPITGDTTPAWPYWFTVALSLFWLGLMMNTVNFLDGVDGLAAGVAFIAAVLLFIHTMREGQLSVSLLPLALMGTTLGFLIFNWYPAKIFMGSGAVFLGYVVGALSIIGGAKMATILLVMGLPLLDVAWQAARRIREGKNPMFGDRGHLHFRLIDAGVSPRKIVFGYYVFCTAFGLLALLTTSRSFKLVGIVMMIALVIVGFALVARLHGKAE
ncbi:MAG: undecaprenyl/decaprenyl-phosphate alpha-N-acetylglucosaminyl 1-phosphate transferase [Anaerolineae bacterium]|nr:undecaprenyl/decaprenyl-phosphate alpha-N-acetylglucosaminyl 1-phosphate transferase [Anaerolineae bacterium]